jgi:hypothetical protein
MTGGATVGLGRTHAMSAAHAIAANLLQRPVTTQDHRRARSGKQRAGVSAAQRGAKAMDCT